MIPDTPQPTLRAPQPVAAPAPHSAFRNPQSPTPSLPQSTLRTPQSPPAWRFLGLAHGSYVLFETGAGLVLLDRRAVHERIWFERLQAQFRAGETPSQRLLLPVPVELDPVATALLLDKLAFLNAHGVEIAEFGRNFFRIEGVPAASLSTGGAIVSGPAYDAIREDMVDMETFAVLRAARRFHLPIMGLRGISDGKSELSRYEDWTEYLHVIDEKLGQALDLFVAQAAAGALKPAGDRQG